ncbi:MAG: hypothetical protein ACOCZ2_02580 [Thermodesulfobacteriota bacterium]
MSANSFINFFLHNSVPVPLWQLAVLILVVSFFLLIKNYRMGLLVTYFLIFLWVFILQFSHFKAMLDGSWIGMSIFLLLGFVIGLFAVMSLFG